MSQASDDTECTRWGKIFQINNNANKMRRNILKVKRALHLLAHISLALDIGIAIVTSLTLFGLKNPEFLLLPIQYALTAVVILSIFLFAALIYLRHQEKILDLFINKKYRYVPQTSWKRRLIKNLKRLWRKKLNFFKNF